MDPSSLPQRGLWNFRAYVKARELFELIIADLSNLSRHPACGRLVAQQIASADSIASNFEEGYGRRSPRDFAHFLVIARGSAQETAGRYERFKYWLSPEVVTHRTALCGDIIGILSATIRTLREDEKSGRK
jgi:four helix bundle protein